MHDAAGVSAREAPGDVFPDSIQTKANGCFCSHAGEAIRTGRFCVGVRPRLFPQFDIYLFGMGSHPNQFRPFGQMEAKLECFELQDGFHR